MSGLKLGAGSQVKLGASGLTIELEMTLFAAWLWQQIRAWFSEPGPPAWLQAPFRVMTAEGRTAGSPRWKQRGLDGLSWLIFGLLVAAKHPLVKLWQTT